MSGKESAMKSAFLAGASAVALAISPAFAQSIDTPGAPATIEAAPSGTATGSVTPGASHIQSSSPTLGTKQSQPDPRLPYLLPANPRPEPTGDDGGTAGKTNPDPH
jgi:hypothetical protein